MSTVSGVFPNAITPTFSSQIDPAEQAKQRKQAETAAFIPVEETEAIVATRVASAQQPGRIEAEQAMFPSRQALTDEPSASDVAGEIAIEQAPTQPAPDTDAVKQRLANEAQLEEEIELVRELAERDREVRAHEQAHQSVGGQYAGPIELTYQNGPDGKRYAVAGEVSIDMSAVPNDPEATLAKAEQVRRAALAPAEPSVQDRQVAALATQMSIEAQNDIRQMQQQEAAKLAEDRDEQQSLSADESRQSEDRSADDSEKDESVAAENAERLQDILDATSEAVESALNAAYRQQPIKDIGFNLDTSV